MSSNIKESFEELFSGCEQTFDSLNKDLGAVESEIAKRENFPKGINAREEILRRLKIDGLIEESTLLLRWHSLYMDLVDWEVPVYGKDAS